MRSEQLKLFILYKTNYKEHSNYFILEIIPLVGKPQYISLTGIEMNVLINMFKEIGLIAAGEQMEKIDFSPAQIRVSEEFLF